MITWSALQPEIDAADVEQAAREQAGRDQQRHRQRDLRRRERRPEARRRARARRLAALPLQRRHEIRARAVQRRKQPEEQAGADRERRRRTACTPGSIASVTVSVACGGSSAAISCSVHRATTTPPRPPNDREQARFAEQLRARAVRGRAPIDSRTAISPARRRRAPAAGWRCWRRRSAARTRSRRCSSVSGSFASRDTVLCPRRPSVRAAASP